MRGAMWLRYLRFWGPDVDADVDAELQFHLDACAADLEARGHPPEEARRIARARFGDVAATRGWLRAHDHRRHRQEQRAEHMDTLLQDLRYALRTLRQQPAFALAVVLVLALGIGAATAMFSAVDAALLRPLPFQRGDRLVMLHHVGIPYRSERPRRWPKSSPDIVDARALRDVFTHVEAYAPGGLNLSGVATPTRTRVALVTPGLFPALGVGAALGRGFTADEGTPEGAPVVILSDRIWRRQFGGDPGIVGRDVRLNEVPYRVVGIMPPGFGFPEDTELWLPLPVPTVSGRMEAFRSYLPSTIVARLAPGVTAARAAARMDGLIASFADRRGVRTPPNENPPLDRFRDALVGTRRTALLLLMGATALVLLVACANVSNLLLSRAAARRGEMALRAALGAGRGRLVRQLLVESLLLALAGGAVGVALAYASLGVLAALTPEALAGTAPPRVDLRVLAFSVATAVATGIAFGLWPALGAARADPGETVQTAAAARGTTSREGARLRRAFVVAELALALMLAVGAGLMLRSFQALLATDAGVRPERVATLELSLADAAYGGAAARRAFFERVLARLRAAPGVEAAAAVNELPMRGTDGIAISVEAEGRPRPEHAEPVYAQFLNVSPDYFRTLGVAVRRGGLFTLPYDTARREVVIGETLARRLWPGEDPVGRRMTSPMGDLHTVVGVVADVRPKSLESEVIPQMYYPLDASVPSNAAILARGPLDPGALAERLRAAVRAVDPVQPVYNVRPMAEVIAGAIAPRRANTLLISAFGAVAVVLAALGVYGVIAYGVVRRTREVGIRVALGARRGAVLALFLREGVALAALGVALGLAGAWGLRRVLAGLLYGVTPGDPVTFVGAAVVLLAVAAVATVLPARQALRVDPAATMRVE
jgi:predicted permease